MNRVLNLYNFCEL